MLAENGPRCQACDRGGRRLEQSAPLRRRTPSIAVLRRYGREESDLRVMGDMP
jgi:hypothetical protein